MGESMAIELQINNSSNLRARYVSWTPSPCKIRLTDTTGLTQPVAVTLRNKPSAGGGRVVFYSSPTAAARTTLSLTLPLTGASVGFLVGGKFGKPSVADGDVTIQARAGTKVLGEVPLMVRIRKNANKLTSGERDRFVAAFATFNDRGTGRFADFRNMHTNAGSPEAHGAPGFLPWHRAYLLDLERELQAIDPSVALPYWRFDQPAPLLFTREFLGVSDVIGSVQFSPTNPLQFWKTDGVQGINRRPFFNTSTGRANVISEAQTLALGNQYALFQEMEFDPHGLAHTSFGGSISSIPTAAKDPLFFLLHANVDRLWAKWQRRFGRFDSAQAASFASNAASGGNRIGHNLPDTMWPWNGITGAPRPPTAPGGGLASSPCVSAPGPQPLVRESLDYQGVVSATSRLGFDYDDVRYV
jgi:tyrosinase